MRSWNREFYTKQAQRRGIDRSAPQNPGLLPNRGKAWALGLSCGCGMLFLEAGLLPLLALLNLLPRRDFFGNASPFLVVSGTLPFVVVGLYLIGNASASFLQKGKLSARLLFNLAVGFLALPLHSWLFFGKPEGVSITNIALPGGTGISLFDTSPASFIMAKIAVALLATAIDLHLISEVFELGWFIVEGSPSNKDRNN